MVASGPIVFALRIAGGRIASGLLRLGIPEIEARRYEGKIQGGNILISVRTRDREEIMPAEIIFKEANAQDICTTAESSSAKDNPATEHPSRPSEAACSHARA